MFCTNCGSQMPENSTFCTNCGAKISNGQPDGGQNIGYSNMNTPNFNNSDTGTPNFNNSNFNNQSYGSPNFGNSNYNNPNMNGYNMNSMPMGTGKKNNTPIVVGAIIAGVLALCLVVFGATKLFGGSNSSPKKVVQSFFNAVEDGDVKEMMDLMYIPNEYKSMVDLVEEQLDSTFSDLKDEMEEELGKNWTSEIKYGDVEEVGDDTYEVEVTLDGDTDTVTVIKKNGKYYIDPSNML
jgi:hypothetical protein